MKKLFSTCLLTVFFLTNTVAQKISVFSLMERTDLRLTEIRELAMKQFEKNGTGRGTGYKQFQRWLYEMQYHLDENGYIRPADYDWKEYQKFRMTNAGRSLTAGQWTELGPFTWIPNAPYSGNPGTGRVNGIAIHPSDTTTIYVASDGGGIWKSSNSGSFWQPLTDDDNTQVNVKSIAIAPSDKNILYAGTTTGIIKSADAGQRWTATALGTGLALKIIIDPSNVNTVLAASSTGIFRSVDGGTTWIRVHTLEKRDLEFKPGNSSIVYATGSGNAVNNESPFWKSTDNGQTWNAVTSAQGIFIDGRTHVAVTPANAEVIFVAQAHDDDFGRLYISTNGGASFSVRSSGLPSGKNYFGYSFDGTGEGGIANYAMSLSVKPTNVNEVHIASPSAWASFNAGFTFSQSSYWHYPTALANGTGYNHADVHDLVWVGKTLYSCSDGGVFKSADDGITWIDISAGMGIRQFYSIANSHTNPDIIAAGAQDNGLSAYNNGQWRDYSGGDGLSCIISPLNSNIITGIVNSGGFCQSTDGGLTSAFKQQPAAGTFGTPLATGPNSKSIYGGWKSIYKSIDNGSSWTNISLVVADSNFQQLKVARSDSNFIYAAHLKKLYVTGNGGLSWSVRTIPFFIIDLEVSPLNPQKIWLLLNTTGTSKVMKSTDAGLTFTDIGGNLPAITPRCITVDAGAAEDLYVGMNVGVYHINNNNATWTELTDNLPKVTVSDIEVQQSAGKLRVSTFGRGVWEMPRQAICNIPTGLAVSSVTYKSATVSWNPLPGALSYDLQYKDLNSPLFLTISGITGTSRTITNLLEQSFYSVKVRAHCDYSNSNFSNLSTFITPANPCAAPSNLTANPGLLGAALSWGAVPNALYYQVRYRRINESQWTTSTTLTTATNHIVTGLSPGTTYMIQVTAACPRGAVNFSQVIITTDGFFFKSGDITGNEKDIHEPGTQKKILLFPNPAVNTVAVHLPRNGEVYDKVTVMDIQGREIISVPVSGWKVRIDISRLKAAMYCVRATGRQTISSGFFIKQ